MTKWIRRLITTSLLIVLIFNIGLAIVSYVNIEQMHTAREIEDLEDAMEETGEQAAQLMWIALSFWLTMQLIKRAGKILPPSIRTYLQQAIKWLRDYHRMIGWVALGLTLAHGIYYLYLWLTQPQVDIEAFDIWSGIAATSALILLAGWGEWLQRHGKDMLARRIHWFLALLTIVGMLIHESETFGRLFVVIMVMTILYFIWRWRTGSASKDQTTLR